MTSPHTTQVRLLLSAALALFTVTVGIGILNGIDLVEFERKALVTHLHVGTLGWITLSVMAAALWLFGQGDEEGSDSGLVRFISISTPVTVTAYSLAFLTTTNNIRPALGTLVGIVILVTLVWTVRQARGRTLSVPHLGILAGVTTSVVGAVLGILLGLRLAGNESITDRTFDAHPGAMVVGFLIPVGMAFVEWALDGSSITRRATLAGRLQIGLPFLGGILVITGLLLDIIALAIFSLPFEIIGVVILVVRMRSRLSLASFTSIAPTRHGVTALAFLIVNITLLVIIVAKYFAKDLEPPRHLLLALDHSIFIGVMTNAILALISRFRRAVATTLDHLVFAGINLGVPLFLAGLLLESAPLKQTGTPIMGGAILLAIATGIPALRGATQDPSM